MQKTPAGPFYETHTQGPGLCEAVQRGTELSHGTAALLPPERKAVGPHGCMGEHGHPALDSSHGHSLANSGHMTSRDLLSGCVFSLQVRESECMHVNLDSERLTMQTPCFIRNTVTQKPFQGLPRNPVRAY